MAFFEYLHTLVVKPKWKVAVWITVIEYIIISLAVVVAVILFKISVVILIYFPYLYNLLKHQSNYIH